MKHSERAADIFFSQVVESDPWFYVPYWIKDFRHDGCGLISLVLCVDLLTGKELTPLDAYYIRQEAGLDQRNEANKEGTSVCGGDVTLRLNPVNRRLFGIESRPLERSVEAFREVLSREGSVIWASSRNCDFIDNAGVRRFHRDGHVIMFWKYENGLYYAKDCGHRKEMGNNVPYTEEFLREWLAGTERQQFEIVRAE